MNISKFLSSLVSVFIFIFLFEMVVHGFLLRGLYNETPQVWRTQEEIQTNMPILILFQLAKALVLSFLFSQIFPNGGIMKGITFGLYFGVIAAILGASWYIFLPVSTSLGWSWFVTSLIEGLAIGLILGSIYRQRLV